MAIRSRIRISVSRRGLHILLGGDNNNPVYNAHSVEEIGSAEMSPLDRAHNRPTSCALSKEAVLSCSFFQDIASYLSTNKIFLT